MGGSHADPKNGVFLGGWGSFGVPTPMKGVTTYSIAANRQRPFAGAFYNAFFNTFRRCKNQVLYVVPPFAIAYAIMDWATHKNHFINSKEGRLLTEGAED
ncbi:ubiquinol--cytochrome-c reductase subunit 8 [Myotisia sp. PD_48]|nr:ubiquinol--cytochrome-c reductase subunit 8 [Myotisia sp. PD_48]